MTMRQVRWKTAGVLVLAIGASGAAGCNRGGDNRPRATGYVEATEVRVAAEVGGRVLECASPRATASPPTAHRPTRYLRRGADRPAAPGRARPGRRPAPSPAGRRRAEDIRQARAQTDSSDADVRAAVSEQQSAEADVQRFEALLQSNAGSVKQRDDAVTRRDVAAAHDNAARERARAAAEGLARLSAD
jgi:multidrug resistance efflux pump